MDVNEEADTDSAPRMTTPVVSEGERARAVIGRGGVLAFRTDTFYGLGANPFDAAAVSRVNDLKGREGKPILVVISDVEMADKLVAHRTALFNLLARRFWAGPLTLVAPAREGLPGELTAGTHTIGVRLPDDESVRALVRACGGALTATSANRTGEPPARSAAEARRAFPAGLDLVVDGGAARTLEPSTVVDVSGESARLIREGVIAWREIEDACED